MKSWDIKKLGEVCSFFNGQAHEKCIDENGKFILINSKFVSSEGENFKKTNNALSPLFKDDIVMVMSDVPNGKTLAKCFIVDEDDTYTLNQRICVIRSKKFVTRFLYYQLNRNKYFLSFDNGENQSNLRKDVILNCKLFVPPLAEQQEIVSILDDAFESIERAKSNAEQNLKNAKELFDSYVQNIFENKNEDWKEKKLNEITEVKDGTHDSPKYISEGIPFVTQKNIRHDGLSLFDTKFIAEIDHEKFYKRSNVTYGDILISMIGANRGMAAIVKEKRIFSIKNVGLIKESKNINTKFLLYYLKSSLAMKYVMYMSNGGAQEFIGLTALRAFPIPYPSLKEQDAVVINIDNIAKETKRLESIYQQKLNDLEELKKSILQKAFNGELFNSK